MKTQYLIPCSALLLFSCGTPGPVEIDASGNESVTSMGLDYKHFVSIAADMSKKLVTKSFLDFPPYQGNHPVKMVLSDIDNRTDLRNLPTNQITGRVRSAALNSGKVRFVSSFGSGTTDTVVKQGQEVVNDPRFNQTQTPKQGSLTFPQMALRTVIDFLKSSDGRARQNTYVVHMFVSDIKTGEIYWEEFSEPVAKKAVKGGFGW